MSTSNWSKQAAEDVADYVLENFNSVRPDEDLEELYKGIDIGIVLGTGWGEVLGGMTTVPHEFNLKDLPYFWFLGKLQQIEGHKRMFQVGFLNGKKVAFLKGRIHMNESFEMEELAKVVRLQVEMLFHMGVKHLILTNAAGSLRPEVKVGDVVAQDGFVSLFAPPRPLWGGEFVSGEDVLKEENIAKIEDAARKAGLDCHRGAGAMVRGPDFEGRKHDKRILRDAGATVAMMSILPEATVAALYPDVNVYAVSFITNSDSEEHSHEENQKRAKAASTKLGDLLLNLVDTCD